MAKMFLHSQKPGDKYKFFLKGTQLAQLMEDYEKLSEQIHTIKSILATKAERVKELKDAQKQASASWQEIEATKNVETQITKLKNELVWVQVVEIEKAMHDAVRDQLTKQTTLNKYEEAISDLKERLQAAKAAVQEAETNREEMDNSAGDDEMAALKKKIDEANIKTRAVKTEQRQMIADLERLEGQVRKCDAEMEAALKLTDSNTREKRERAQQKLDEVNAQIQARSMEATTAKGKAAQFKLDADDKKRQMEHIRNDQEAAQQTLMQSEAIIRGIESRRANAMNAFGPQAVAVLNSIDRERAWQEKPVSSALRLLLSLLRLTIIDG